MAGSISEPASKPPIRRPGTGPTTGPVAGDTGRRSVIPSDQGPSDVRATTRSWGRTLTKLSTYSGAVAFAAAALVFSAPAEAQIFGQGGQKCGTAAADVTWIGGSAETSDISTSDGPLYTTAEVSGEAPKFFGFTLGTDLFLRLEASSPTGGDTVLALIDAAGNALGTDDDGGGNFASRLETYVPAGEYCVAVGGYTELTIPVEIQIGREEHVALTTGQTDLPPDQSACTSETAAADLAAGPLDAVLGSGQTLALDVVPAEQRFHRFTLDQPTSMTLRAENENADPVLRLYDGSGTILYENDDYQNLNSLIQVVDPLPAGTYCIEVTALGDQSLAISFAAEPFDEAAYLLSAYDSAQISPPLDGSYPVIDLGALSTQISHDVVLGGRAAKWATFTVTETSLVMIRAIGFENVDTQLALFGITGEAIDRNDDATVGVPNARVVAELAPGTYTVAISTYDGAQGGGARLLLERFVRAQ